MVGLVNGGMDESYTLMLYVNMITIFVLLCLNPRPGLEYIFHLKLGQLLFKPQFPYILVQFKRVLKS